MDWLKAEEIEAAAKAGDKEAIACTMKHWTQILKATREELIIGYRDFQVGFNSDWCALCTRFVRKPDRGICPFIDDETAEVIETLGWCDFVCNQLYYDASSALSAFIVDKINITRMRTFVKPVVDRLTEIYNSYPKENIL